MNLAVVALVILIGWPALSLVTAFAVGAMAKARDHVATLSTGTERSRYALDEPHVRVG